MLTTMRLSNKPLGPEHGCYMERLKSSLRKFYGRYGNLYKQCQSPPSGMPHHILKLGHIKRPPQSIRLNIDIITELDLLPDYGWCPKSIYDVDVTCEKETLTPQDT